MDESEGNYEAYDLKTWLDLPESSNWIEVLDPKAHVLAYWDQSARPDGRMFSQARPTQTVSSLLKHSAGSALVKQGDTKVLTAISIEIGQPAPEFPDHGDVMVSVSSTTTSTASASTLQPRFYDRLQAWLQRMLDDLLPPKLNLLTGKACIRLVVSVMILQDAGNLMDASLLSCMAAWKNTTLPTMDHLMESEGRLWWKENLMSSVSNSDTTTTTTTQSASEQSKEYRISLTMGIVRDAKSDSIKFLVDPSSEEEKHTDGELTLVVELQSRKIQVEYTGSMGLEASDFALASKLANGRADELVSLL
ncbi:unnamed protein product [Cylindrotheca closterium]|uniref:Ribosomal RNA-processing protein 43 n=1 Tax=Cylindrotheca closterium TaxID=2856 RepID=A0AAD2JKJ4_9STRA|nr:unnamed protein product [Cylindrotheca closterium]